MSDSRNRESRKGLFWCDRWMTSQMECKQRNLPPKRSSKLDFDDDILRGVAKMTQKQLCTLYLTPTASPQAILY